jgi:hypothetical protein
VELAFEWPKVAEAGLQPELAVLMFLFEVDFAKGCFLVPELLVGVVLSDSQYVALGHL